MTHTIRIALHGLARTGKDSVGRVLISLVPGLTRVAFGDLIKQDLDPVIREHFGFSAFTEINEEKELIRPVLVAWGYANHASIERRFFATLPALAVNTRIFRARECELWGAAGGVVWEVVRPGAIAAEPQELKELEECRSRGLITRVVRNHGTLEDLRAEVARVLALDYPQYKETP